MIKKYLIPTFIAIALIGILNSVFAQKKDINVLIISGGHGLIPQNFFEMFSSYNNITYEFISQPLANLFYNNEFTDTYDAFVVYDIGRKITEEHKQDFLNMLNKGKGCLFLHHSIVSYQDWNEYEKIVGGHFLSEPVIKDGKEVHPASGWKLNQTFNVKIEDKNHPITNGIDDFIVDDETYSHMRISDSLHYLLSTDNPDNEKYIAWTNHYGNSDIVYMQLGHGNSIFNNLNYKKFIQQSIQWISKK